MAVLEDDAVRTFNNIVNLLTIKNIIECRRIIFLVVFTVVWMTCMSFVQQFHLRMVGYGIALLVLGILRLTKPKPKQS